MKHFIKDIWYGEPVRVFGLLSTAGVAYVGFADPNEIITAAVVIVNAIAGFYGFRKMTTPEYVERISTTEGGPDE